MSLCAAQSWAQPVIYEANLFVDILVICSIQCAFRLMNDDNAMFIGPDVEEDEEKVVVAATAEQFYGYLLRC